MLEKIEFYTCPDGSVNMKPENASVRSYDMSCRDVTQEMLLYIKDLYPEAFNALAKVYSASEKNKNFFEFKMVHRFIRCNFGEYDGLTLDITNPGTFNFEHVSCPLRGECVHEGVICRPKKCTHLSQREEEVARLLGEGLNRAQIAEMLDISPFTVSRHIANIKDRLGLARTAQIASRFKV